MLSEQAKRDFCAIMLEQYGLQIDVDNELLPVFYLAYRSAQVTEETSLTARENIQQIITNFEKNTAAKISKLEMKQFQFSDSKNAFWFAFGKYGVSVVVISFLLFSAWLFNCITEKHNQNIEQISYLLEKSPVQEKKLNDTITIQFITLSAAKDLKHAIAGKNFVFNRTCNCIEIPLFYHKSVSIK